MISFLFFFCFLEGRNVRLAMKDHTFMNWIPHNMMELYIQWNLNQEYCDLKLGTPKNFSRCHFEIFLFFFSGNGIWHFI